MTAYPQPSNAAVSERMRANRRRDSRAELAVRSAVHRAGLRFFVDHPLRVAGRIVRPDIVFPRARLTVFIDGCFWHACPDHGTEPRHNEHYWAPKLRRNVERDRVVDDALMHAGWRVQRFWEHEPAGEVAATIGKLVASRLSPQPLAD
jgi:DNA mismatch endonuclease (patch repair protein)